MSDLIPIDDGSGILRFVLDLEGGSVDPTPVEVITDYRLLNNLPSINGVTLIGNKTLNDLNVQEKMTPISLSVINALPNL